MFHRRLNPFFLLCMTVFILAAGCNADNTQDGPDNTSQRPTPSPTGITYEPGRNPNGNASPGSPSDHFSLLPPEQTPDLHGGPESENRQPRPLTLAELRQKYPNVFVLNAPSSKRQVALTFDDAPDDTFTPQILDVLQREGVKATFFVVGNRAEAHPDIMERIVREGHAVGNHSYNHANLPKLTDEQFREQIRKTDEIIRRFTGYTPRMVRPPYGEISEEQIKWLASQHKTVVNWNVDSLDWKGLTAEQVATNVLGHVHPGSIVLMHSGGGIGEDLSGTVNALPLIIRTLREAGIEMVTVPELLELPPGVS
ncbi:MAG: polysaccharide deacetylase family protein [Bacillota bacterium]